MSVNKNYISREEMRLYLEGKLTGKAAHRVERYLLENDFAQEAIEGFEGFDQQDIDADIEVLNQRLSTDTRPFNWYYVAASVALLLVAFLGVWFYANKVEQSNELSYQEEQVEKEQPKESPEQKNVPVNSEESSKEAKILKPEVSTSKKKEIKKESVVATRTQPDDVAKESSEMVEAPMLVAKSKGDVDAVEELDVELDGMSLAQDQLEADLIEEISTDQLQIDTTYLNSRLAGRAAGVAITSERIPTAKPQTQSVAHVKEKKRVAIRGQSSIKDYDLGYVSGQITDEVGNPVPGVNVMIKGSSTGTLSDIDGNYQIARKGNDLNFSFIGMESIDIKVGDQDTINVVMESDVQALSEVVVVGYGTSDQEEQGYKSARPAIDMSDYRDYLETNLKYPEAAKEQAVEGKVILKLTIDPSGTISAINIKRNLGFGCDEEAIRLVKEGPTWTPAERDGQPVSSEVRVKVKFDLKD